MIIEEEEIQERSIFREKITGMRDAPEEKFLRHETSDQRREKGEVNLRSFGLKLLWRKCRK